MPQERLQLALALLPAKRKCKVKVNVNKLGYLYFINIEAVSVTSCKDTGYYPKSHTNCCFL